jgi:SAM-dependent methyltransferase
VRFLAAVLADQRARGIVPRLLDLGCGDGSVLAALGVPAAVGLDGSEGAVAAARARGLAAVRGAVAAPPFRTGAFSLVTMFHVLEHVADPAEPLRAAHALLRDGGDLVVQVPNAASWQAAWLGPRWSGFDVPRHLVSYAPAALRAVLARHGFAVVREGRAFLRDDTALFASSLVPHLYPPARTGRAGSGRAAWLADLGYLAVTVATLPVVLLANLRGGGATVMVQARRV